MGSRRQTGENRPDTAPRIGMGWTLAALAMLSTAVAVPLWLASIEERAVAEQRQAAGGVTQPAPGIEETEGAAYGAARAPSAPTIGEPDPSARNGLAHAPSDWPVIAGVPRRPGTPPAPLSEPQAPLLALAETPAVRVPPPLLTVPEPGRPTAAAQPAAPGPVPSHDTPEPPAQALNDQAPTAPELALSHPGPVPAKASPPDLAIPVPSAPVMAAAPTAGEVSVSLADAGRWPPMGSAPPPLDLAVLLPARVEDSLALNRATRRALQIRLRLIGHDPGSADGIFGPRTRTAIADLQAIHGMPSTGYFDEDLKEVLEQDSRRPYAQWITEQRRTRQMAVREPRIVEQAALPPARNAPACDRDASGTIIENQSFKCDLAVLQESLRALFGRRPG